MHGRYGRRYDLHHALARLEHRLELAAQLPYISPISPLYLPYISPTSPLHLLVEVAAQLAHVVVRVPLVDLLERTLQLAPMAAPVADELAVLARRQPLLRERLVRVRVRVRVRVLGLGLGLG